MPGHNPALPTANPATTTVLKVSLLGTAMGQQVLNTWYYMGQVASTTMDADNMHLFVAQWKTDLLPGLIASVSDKVVWNEVRVENLTSPDFAVITSAIAALDGTGLRAGEALPPQNAIAFSRKTNIIGKRGRGSIRLPGISESDQVNGVITAAGLLTALTFLRDDRFMHSPAPVIGAVAVSFVPSLAKRTSVTPLVVTAAILRSWKYWTNISSQNSRKMSNSGS